MRLCVRSNGFGQVVHDDGRRIERGLNSSHLQGQWLSLAKVTWKLGFLDQFFSSIFQAIFDTIQKSGNQNTTYRTEVSYLEIYNEKVRDLLRSSRKQPASVDKLMFGLNRFVRFLSQDSAKSESEGTPQDRRVCPRPFAAYRVQLLRYRRAHEPRKHPPNYSIYKYERRFKSLSRHLYHQVCPGNTTRRLCLI